MIAPFNIRDLRDNIGDDADIERSLLSTLVSSAEESLLLLEEQWPKRQNAVYDKLWRTHMHQIKGAALNVGADALRQAAEAAQDAYEAEPRIKLKLLVHVAEALALVKAYIDELYPSP